MHSLKKIIVERLQQNRRKIWEWSTEQCKIAPPPFYCSIDLRDSGHKVVPVDCNLYPAGFNNICPEDIRASAPIFREHIKELTTRLGRAEPRQVLILPESHTHNPYYVENLFHLIQIIQSAGFEVRLGWYGPLPDPASGKPVLLKSQTEKLLEAHPIEVVGSVLSSGDFVPDLILLNNDFSSGYPGALDAVAQPIVPSYTAGWHSRKKSDHFVHYNQLAVEFAQILGIDPWLIQVDTEEVEPVDFNEGKGIEETSQAVERILARTKKAYETHKINRKPFVFVKNNMGTYGIGIMVVHSADDLRQMNRRTKNKMSVGKNRLPINSLVVQEGIPTATLVDRLAAEPVVYLLGEELIGGFLRTNPARGADVQATEENLNAPGMVFRKLCMSDLRRPGSESPGEEPANEKTAEPMLELVYGWIGRISALAAGREIQASTRKRF